MDELTMASTGSCINFAHQEGRARLESNVSKMDMWTVNSRDLNPSVASILDIGEVGEIMLGKKNISTS